MNRKKKMTLLQKRKMTGFLFILPWFVGFLVFYVRSILLAGQFAFSELNMDALNGGYSLTNVGWENFRYAFRVHGTFKQILTTSVLDMLVDVPLITFFSLFMAILLNKKFKGRTVVRAIFFLPIILNSGAITAAMELSAQMMQGGISSQAAEMLSSSASAGSTLALDIDFFIDMFMNLGIPVTLIDYIITAVARINDIIAASGVQIIIFIAALQSIPGSMYEVAKIEGATGYETFWKITFPMVMPHIITNVVYTIVDSFTESGVVDLAYKTAFNDFNYGLSSVFSLVSTIITCIILVTVCGLIQKRTFYYN
ncbi:sugar ABC transporter permease [Anaerocolumna sp. AGMB13020]|uniref:carbohydrate ABC transporter permease n=1 Tax=Anaerocolumna sp. AGMB13020 TaxID=3081750 RepID=UPI0029557670|nr:sugar ABC transporter permease [Anaerocolumna sp. AGMB13020]WOO37244.1 sugar ABC transporter permease [Anaerocolumna sp. AGMB13020]